MDSFKNVTIFLMSLPISNPGSTFPRSEFCLMPRVHSLRFFDD